MAHIMNFFTNSSYIRKAIIKAYRLWQKQGHYKKAITIDNGHRTGWSPVRPLVMRVINKILLIASIGLHEVVLTINQSYYTIRETNYSSVYTSS